MPFDGVLTVNLSANVVFFEHRPAATEGSSADNLTVHVPAGGPFQKNPSNKASVKLGSASVLINNRPAARMGDMADTCSDPIDLPNGTVVGNGTVLIGG